MFFICSIAAFLKGVYFSSGKETNCPNSGPIRAICRRSMMENRLANRLVIFLIVPKMNIALKEANETEYWLELLMQSEILSDNDARNGLQHCKEICRILDSIVASGRKNETL